MKYCHTLGPACVAEENKYEEQLSSVTPGYHCRSLLDIKDPQLPKTVFMHLILIYNFTHFYVYLSVHCLLFSLQMFSGL